MAGVAWAFDPLPMFGFDLVAADPPWLFALRSEATGAGKSPQAHYDCMPLNAIKALPVGQLCGPAAWLFLWTCAPLLPEAVNVMSAWGFRYKSRVTWRKTTRTGKVRMGPGYIVRTMTEDVLIGTIGAPPYAHALPSIFDGLAREHSRKPEEFYTLVERFAPTATKLDLFSRQSREGWATWGNESTRFDAPLDDAALPAWPFLPEAAE